jgi:hypothetical protein
LLSMTLNNSGIIPGNFFLDNANLFFPSLLGVKPENPRSMHHARRAWHGKLCSYRAPATSIWSAEFAYKDMRFNLVHF